MPEINFIDDRDGCLFTGAVHRKEMVSSEKILSLLKTEPELPAREIGRQLALSQEDLARELGVSFTTVNRW